MSIQSVVNSIVEKYPDIKVLYNEPLKNHTSFRIGGAVNALYMPKSSEELTFIAKQCRDNGVRLEIIGNGSNLLVSNELPQMIVIKMSGGMDEIKLIDETTIYAQCGALLSKIATFALKNDLTGFEFAHGIPGSLGGGVVMNAGAYGGELKDVISSVISTEGEFDNAACDFSYRHSRFSDSDAVVLGAYIKLTKGNHHDIEAKMNELSEKRKNSQPLTMPSAGSTFKRPVGGYAAALIDQAGLKGFTVGGARVSEKHAGFVVNGGDATYEDVMKLIEEIKKRVLDMSGIALECEVKIIK